MKAIPFPPTNTVEVHERKHRIVLSQELMNKIVAQYCAGFLGVEGDHWDYTVAPEGSAPPPAPSYAPWAPAAVPCVVVITENLLKLPRAA